MLEMTANAVEFKGNEASYVRRYAAAHSRVEYRSGAINQNRELAAKCCSKITAIPLLYMPRIEGSLPLCV